MRIYHEYGQNATAVAFSAIALLELSKSVYREFGQKFSALNFSTRALTELSAADDPQSAYSVIRLGQRLVELKDACQHGEFTEIAEKCCGLTIRYCTNLMRVYREYGQNDTAVSFSTKALIELSKSDDPQSALAEAEKLEGTVTAKQAKEIVALQRMIAEEKAKIEAVQPSIDKLIPSGGSLGSPHDHPHDL